jgi:LEA14-like dessication related protein
VYFDIDNPNYFNLVANNLKMNVYYRNETIAYVSQPKGFIVKGHTNQVCHMHTK